MIDIPRINFFAGQVDNTSMEVVYGRLPETLSGYNEPIQPKSERANQHEPILELVATSA